MQQHENRATELMSDFAERTGLSSSAEPRRYLWTDAFATCNFLELYRRTGDGEYRELCVQLIDQVHQVLGRHRPDDSRTGWISGLPEEEGAMHPTKGGLRIGKPLPERGPGEPQDERLEWERDGQYFHYLTKWMDALARAALLLGEPRYLTNAVEMARSVLPRFLLRTPTGEVLGIGWKMSIDLSRTQTAGSSPHDALDGYVTLRMLERAGGTSTRSRLEPEIVWLRELSEGRNWATADPLGIGGLLLDAFRLLIISDHAGSQEDNLLAKIIAGATVGLEHFARQKTLKSPPVQRLAFRELGLAIGLQTLELARSVAEESSVLLAGAARDDMQQLSELAPLASQVVAFWSDAGNRDNETWRDHQDINDVMLATALLEAQRGTAAPLLPTVSSTQ